MKKFKNFVYEVVLLYFISFSYIYDIYKLILGVCYKGCIGGGIGRDY